MKRPQVNWEKCEGYLIGDWLGRAPPVLPWGFKWGREGLRMLGVHIGMEEYRIQKNI